VEQINHLEPEIFNQIIRQRVADYIDNEVKKLVAEKTNEIIKDVLGNLKLDSQRYQDMLRHETNLVIKAVYNGVDVPQREES
jgi:hypothetical protein